MLYDMLYDIPNVTINNVEIGCVINFNLLGININEINNKTTKTMCILHNLK